MKYFWVTQDKRKKILCKIILQDSRITALAHNPLLLTTLLFVKRWIGYLPTKKCQLYQEMIKLLLVSWNAAAHSKMEMDETEPSIPDQEVPETSEEGPDAEELDDEMSLSEETGEADYQDDEDMSEDAMEDESEIEDEDMDEDESEDENVGFSMGM